MKLQVLKIPQLMANVLTNDRDPDGNAITKLLNLLWRVKAGNAGQTVTIDKIGELTLNADGTYHFVPATNWNRLSFQQLLYN